MFSCLVSFSLYCIALWTPRSAHRIVSSEAVVKHPWLRCDNDQKIRDDQRSASAKPRARQNGAFSETPLSENQTNPAWTGGACESRYGVFSDVARVASDAP